MNDRILLVVTGVAAAGGAALIYGLTGEYTPAVSWAFAVIGVIAYLKRRKRR
jgi:hypothetical protein